MELTRRSLVVYGLLAAVWLLVVIWQIENGFTPPDDLRAAIRRALAWTEREDAALEMLAGERAAVQVCLLAAAHDPARAARVLADLAPRPAGEARP